MNPNRRTPTESFRRPWGCPLTKNRTPWCFGLCHPEEGNGFCGRVASHALTGRTLDALQAYRDRQEAAQSA